MNEEKQWDIWEKQIQAEAMGQRYTAVHVPEKVVGLYRQKPVKLKSNVDFCLGIGGRAVFLDAKVTNERNWNLKQRVFHEKKVHQFAQLLSAEYAGNKAGYLIWFADYGQVAWVPASVIERVAKEGVASIHPKTPGVTLQDHRDMIDFKKLIWPEGFPT